MKKMRKALGAVLSLILVLEFFSLPPSAAFATGRLPKVKAAVASSDSGSAVLPDNSPSAEAPVLSPFITAPVLSPSAVVPVFSPSAEAPTVSPSAVAPVLSPSAEAPVLSPSAEAPVLSPSAEAPVLSPSAEAPVLSPSAGTPVISPSAVAPVFSPSAVAPSLSPPDDPAGPDPTAAPATAAPQNKTFFIRYLTGLGGTIEGQTTQLVEQGTDASEVIAVPEQGYNFLYWSDGKTEMQRQEHNVQKNMTIMAVFERNPGPIVDPDPDFPSVQPTASAEPDSPVPSGPGITTRPEITIAPPGGSGGPNGTTARPTATAAATAKPTAATTSPTPTAATPVVKQITVKSKKLTLGKGEKYKLQVTISPQKASDALLKYKATGKAIKVSRKGKVTAKKKGTGKVTISAPNGVSAKVKVTVKKAPKKISFQKRKKTVKIGTVFKAKTRLPKGSAGHITYRTGKEKVALVNTQGIVVAMGKGKTSVTAETYNGKKAKMKLTVK